MSRDVLLWVRVDGADTDLVHWAIVSVGEGNLRKRNYGA